MCKHSPGGTGFESMKGLWRAAGTWLRERAGEVTGDGAASGAVEDPGLKGSCREAEARPCQERP